MSKKLKRMRETGERIYPNPPTPEDLQKLYEFPTPKVRPKSGGATDRKILIDPQFLRPRLKDMFTKNSKEDMNLQDARRLLNRNAPEGEFAAYIDPQEASWLKGMGGKGKKTKSGLRSYAVSYNPMDSELMGGANTGYKNPDIVNSALESVNRDPYGNVVNTPHDNTAPRINEGRRLPEVPNINPGGGGNGVSSIPNPLAGGSDTRTPAGPGSVTNPNDPYGIQKKIAGGASDLIDKAYVAPTLTPEQRIAATSAETLQARKGVQAMLGTGQTAYGEAAAVGKRISGQDIDPITGQSFLTGKGVDEYMSPHTANVISGMQDQAMRTMQKQRGALQAQHQMAGAGMGSRGALENAAMSAEVQRGLGQQVAGALEGSYAQAAKMKEGDMTREQQRQRYNQMATGEEGRLQIAGSAEQRAGTAAGRSAAAADINMLSGVGADVEGRSQNVLDATMDDFYEERDWGEGKLASAANIASSQPTGTTTTTTGAPQHRKRDKFGRIIAGAAGGWLTSGGNPWGAAAGGFGAAVS